MINILVTSAGGPAGIGLIKSIRGLDKSKQLYNIVAIDCNEMGAGLFLADKHYVVPPMKEMLFIYRDWEKIKEIILKEDINFILPTSESELLLFSTYKKELQEMGIEIYISSPETVKLCNNKFKFWEHLNDKFVMPNPVNSVFLKPDIGAGARGTKKIDAVEGTHLWEYLPGREYTVDVFCDNESNSLGTIVRTRDGVKAGISVKGTILRHNQIELDSERLCKELKIQGPCCIQWKEDSNNIPKLIECNPRLGGGTYFATLAGVNPAEIYLSTIKSSPKKLYPKEIKVTRYFEEIVI